ncbi:MAG: AmmeMemoRadiSam system protein A [Patescibacteria group bacterium]
MNYYVSLARQAIRSFLQSGMILAVPDDTPEALRHDRAAVFVSLHKNGELRGCIGTLEPTTDCVAEEVIANAIAAATRDPRFEPMKLSELSQTDIKVDRLNTPEPATRGSLNPQKYGVIVQSRQQRGVLLPDIEGVNTVAEQVSIAASKAGIDVTKDKYSLQRFTITRFSE